jgi:hypothetical protein
MLQKSSRQIRTIRAVAIAIGGIRGTFLTNAGAIGGQLMQVVTAERGAWIARSLRLLARLVRHPVSGFRDLVAAAFVEFVRHGFHNHKSVGRHSLSYGPVTNPAIRQVFERDAPDRMARENAPYPTTWGLFMHLCLLAIAASPPAVDPDLDASRN